MAVVAVAGAGRVVMAADASEATVSADAKPLVPPALVLGVLVFFAGAIFLADSLGLSDAHSGWAMWPVALILLGVVVWLQPGTDNRSIGIILLVAGLWLLFNAIGFWSYAFWDAWPAILILLGAWMLYRTGALRRRAGGADGYDRTDTGAERVGAFAFLSQIHRRTTGQRLRTGEAIAIAGDCWFDLTDTARGVGPIVVDVLVIASRVRITAPSTWGVELRVLPVLGRAADGREADAQPDDGATVAAAAAPIDLYVRGTAILGAVEIV